MLLYVLPTSQQQMQKTERLLIYQHEASDLGRLHQRTVVYKLKPQGLHVSCQREFGRRVRGAEEGAALAGNRAEHVKINDSESKVGWEMTYIVVNMTEWDRYIVIVVVGILLWGQTSDCPEHLKRAYLSTEYKGIQSNTVLYVEQNAVHVLHT